jgi:hypothetical protein
MLEKVYKLVDFQVDLNLNTALIKEDVEIYEDGVLLGVVETRYRGVESDRDFSITWMSGSTYPEGTFVLHNSSRWISNKETSQEPGDLSSDWIKIDERSNTQKFIVLLKKTISEITKSNLEELSQEELSQLLTVYPSWEEGVSVREGDVLTYNGDFYRVITSHTVLSTWTPDITPALWERVFPGVEAPDWVQPTGAHDSYNIGDRVTFEGSIYESLIDGNTFSPTAYPAGWQLVA